MQVTYYKAIGFLSVGKYIDSNWDDFDFFGGEFVGGGEEVDGGFGLPNRCIATEEEVIDVIAVVLVAPGGGSGASSDGGMVSRWDADVLVDDKDVLETRGIRQIGIGDESVSAQVDAHVALILQQHEFLTNIFVWLNSDDPNHFLPFSLCL